MREVSVSKPVPGGEEDIEEAVPENKLTLLDDLAEGFVIQDCFKLLSWHGPFYDMSTKANDEEWLVPNRNIFREIKKQKSRTEIMIYFVTLHWMRLLLLPLLPPLQTSTSARPNTAKPNSLFPLPLQPTQCEDNEDEKL